jgi:hypothetical protein
MTSRQANNKSVSSQRHSLTKQSREMKRGNDGNRISRQYLRNHAVLDSFNDRNNADFTKADNIATNDVGNSWSSPQDNDYEEMYKHKKKEKEKEKEKGPETKYECDLIMRKLRDEKYRTDVNTIYSNAEKDFNWYTNQITKYSDFILQEKTKGEGDSKLYVDNELIGKWQNKINEYKWYKWFPSKAMEKLGEAALLIREIIEIVTTKTTCIDENRQYRVDLSEQKKKYISYAAENKKWQQYYDNIEKKNKNKTGTETSFDMQLDSCYDDPLNQKGKLTTKDDEEWTERQTKQEFMEKKISTLEKKISDNLKKIEQGKKRRHDLLETTYSQEEQEQRSGQQQKTNQDVHVTEEENDDEIEW